MNFLGIFQNLTASAGSKLMLNPIEALTSWTIIHGIKIIVILLITWIIIRISRAFVFKLVRTFIKKGKLLENKEIQERRVKTLVKVFISTLKIVIWIIAILTILPEFGINPTPLLAGAGLIGLAIGMGSRSLVQDYLAGLFILIEDQYRIGEEINVSGKKGRVIGLNLRRTILKDLDGTVYYIPNGQIKITSNLSRR